MKKSIITAVAIAALAGASGTQADQAAGLKHQIAGVWSLVAQYVEKEGVRTERFGSNPKGIAIYDQSGRYAAILLRSDLPKIASNNAMTGSPEENKAIIHGSTAFYGGWSVDDATRLLTTRIEGSTYPNWDGIEQKRKVSIVGDEMKMCVPGAQIGGTACAIWRRSR